MKFDFSCEASKDRRFGNCTCDRKYHKSRKEFRLQAKIEHARLRDQDAHAAAKIAERKAR